MGAKKSILVVDDSATVRRSLREGLEASGFDVVEADNGERGLEAVQESPVHLMLVDVNMPVMDGFEMIAKVRESPAHKQTPIFVLTTESGTNAAKRGKEVGVTAWIVKPVKTDVLVRGIRAVLGL
jgi:two-component system chemotaxis response regulator CheY